MTKPKTGEQVETATKSYDNTINWHVFPSNHYYRLYYHNGKTHIFSLCCVLLPGYNNQLTYSKLAFPVP